MAAQPETELNEEQASGCQFAATVAKTLATYRDNGDTQEHAVDRFMTEARKPTSLNAEMEKATRTYTSERAELVYAIRNFEPETFGQFEYAVCKMRMLNQGMLDFSKANQIVEDVTYCARLNYKDLKQPDMTACVNKVVNKYRRN